VKCEVSASSDLAYTESLVLGPFDRDRVDEEVGYIKKLDEENHNLPTLREVMRKGHSMYERSKGKASQASYARTKQVVKEGSWNLVGSSSSGVHPVLFRGKDSDTIVRKLAEEKRKALLKAVNSFRPSETVLETGARGNAETAALMKQRRIALSKAAQRASLATTSRHAQDGQDDEEHPVDDESPSGHVDAEGMESADEEHIAEVFEPSSKQGKGKGGHRDEEFYMSYYQKGANTEKGYSLRDGASFIEQAQDVAFDLTGDEGIQERKRRQLRWDKKKKKFIQGTGEGGDNVKIIRTESGAKLPATYRSGRFDEWKAKSRISLPRVGETESENAPRLASRGSGSGGRRWKHNQMTAGKPLDKLSNDYERKVRQMKKRSEAGVAGDGEQPAAKGQKGKAFGKRSGGKSVGRVKNELKTVDQIRKGRKTMDNRRAKNARPSQKGGKRR